MAFLATYPAFTAGYFKMTMDGQIHFIKFEAIAEAFKHFEMPPLVNFMGYGNVGEAFTGMYPWVTGMIFILPKLLIQQPVYALFCGFFLLNLITMSNSYLLTSELTKNLYWRILGVSLYEFNSYHMIVMYGRNAVGEMLAYTFLPLVFYGCIQIWNKKKLGIISLGLGMGMVVNSHAITALLACLVIFAIEFVRVISRKITFKEILAYIYAGIFATITASYTLYNMLNLMLKNQLATPWKGMIEITPSVMWNAMLDNDMGDKANAWNIGVVAFCVLIVLSVRIFQTQFSAWKIWIGASLGLVLVSFSWLPYPDALAQSFLGNIQFLGRLFSFVMLFLMIGLVSYLDQYGMKISAKWSVILITTIMLILSMSGVEKYHITRNDHPIRYYVTNANYLTSLTERDSGWGDYMLIDENEQPVYTPGSDKIKIPVKIRKATYQGIEYQITSEKNQVASLPFIIYNGVKYKVTVNGKQQEVSAGQLLKVGVRTGKNIINVSTRPDVANYVLFTLTCISILIGSILVLLGGMNGGRKNVINAEKI